MVRKVELKEIENLVDKIEYIHVDNTFLTICILHTKHGFPITGQSCPIDENLYNLKMGEDLAYKDAINKLWGYEGYYRKRIIDDLLFKSFEEINDLVQSYIH